MINTSFKRRGGLFLTMGVVLICLMVLQISTKFCSAEPYPGGLPADTPQAVYAIDKLTSPGCSSYKLSESKLNQLSQTILTGGDDYVDIHSLVIIQNDMLVHESYYQGWNRHKLHKVMSVTKSVTSAMVGIAKDQGHIASVDDKLLSFFPEYTDIAHLDAITLKDVLTMSSGLEWNETDVPMHNPDDSWNFDNDAIAMLIAPDILKYVLDKPVTTTPGTVYKYNGGGIDLFGGIIKNKTDTPPETFAVDYLFAPLGITSTSYDWDLYRPGPKSVLDMAGGLSLQPVNMAMFGYLFLKEGQLNGTQVISQDWVAESTAAHISYTSDDITPDYGYTWRRLSDGEVLLHPLVTTNDIYFAAGALGQKIFVAPHLDLVVAITAWDDTGNASGIDIFQNVLRALEPVATVPPECRATPAPWLMLLL